MRILVTAATDFEVARFAGAQPGADLLITGVGVPATIYHLQKALFAQKYDWVIQAGLAGSFSGEIELGMTVLVSHDAFADLGMEEREAYTPVFETSLADKNAPPFSGGWLINPHLGGFGTMRKVKGITVNKVSDSQLQRKQFLQSFAPEVESMEGAALHYVCLSENTRFIQVRSISNWAGDRNKANWKIKDAVSNLNKSLLVLVDELLKH